MSIKKLGEQEVYSMSEIAKEFLHKESKRDIQHFINFLVRCGIVNRQVITYTERKTYVYSVSEWFADRFGGHYYTKSRTYKGQKMNGTLYFDSFLAKVLSRLYRFNDNYPTKYLVDHLFDKIIAETALDYVPKIKQLNMSEEKADKLSFIEKDESDKRSEFRKQLITNVLQSLEEKRNRKKLN